MERSQLGNPLYRKHDDGHLLQVLETCTFFYIYKSWVLTYNSFYCISLKCIHPEHVTAFHVDHLQCQIDLHVLFFFVSVAGLQCIAILFPLNILNSNYLEFALCTSTTQLYTAFCICLLYRFIIIFCFIFKAFVLIKQLIYAWTFFFYFTNLLNASNKLG